MADYSFMRTGLAAPAEPTPLEKDIEHRILSLVCALVEKSMHTALFYCEKAGRTKVLDQDFVYALKYETSVFLDDSDIDDRIREFYEMIRRGEDDSESESDSDSESEETFTEANDECDETIQKINQANRDWDTFQPTDPIKSTLKESINRVLTRSDLLQLN